MSDLHNPLMLATLVKAVAVLLTLSTLAGCRPPQEQGGPDMPPAAEVLPPLDVESIIRQVRLARQGGHASPASVPPSVSPEFGMGDPIQGIIPLSGNQIFPAVASDGNQFLVVWQDSRNQDIYGARVNPEGKLLDVSGFVISSASELQMQPAVAFNGTHFLVVWSDARNLGSMTIYGARVAADGSVIDPNGLAISTAWGIAGYPAVACRDGAECLVVWERSRNIYGARVLADGSVPDGSSIAIAQEFAEEILPAVATNGTDYLVAWQRNMSGNGISDIYARRVQQDGTLPNAAVTITAAGDDQIDPTVASNGLSYLVAWADRRGGLLLEMYAARVNSYGGLLYPGAFPLGSSGHCGYPAAGFNGTDYLVTWFSAIFSEGINAARISTGGSVFSRQVLSSGEGRNFPAVAHAGGQALVVWEYDGSTDDVYGTRMAADGVVLDPSGLLVSGTYDGISNKQLHAAVGFGGDQFLVVWEDFRDDDTTPDLYATRVTASGTLLDPAGIALSTAPGSQTSPKIAHDGTRFLVIWEDQRNGNADVYGARVTADGTVLDPSGIPIATSSRDELRPELAFGGGHFLVVWDELRSSSNSQDIYGARMETGGMVLDPSGILLSNNPFAQSDAAVAFDGTNFLVVWEDFRGSYLMSWEIYGTRVSPSGSVLDLLGLSIHSASGPQRNPAVAFDGSNSLVVWQHESTSDSIATDNILGARVTPSGNVLEPGGISISAAAYAQRDPAVVFDGQGFMVAWQDSRAQQQDDIYAARVQSDGSVPDTSGIAVADTPSREQAPGLATNGAGRTLAVFHRHDPVVPYQIERSRGRFLLRP